MAQLLSSLHDVFIKDTWLTIGSFDGVHIGHQQLIHDLNAEAHQAQNQSVVLTFYPHPTVVLRNRRDAFYLTTPQEKDKLIEELGTDIIVTHPFTHEISQYSARKFVTYLLEHLGFRQLWVGNDFALGNNREGNVNYLTQLGNELGFRVHVIEPITLNGHVVSSSQVRKLLLNGDLHLANELLGRSYRLSGKIVRGDGRGKTIGIPTANLYTGNEKLVPSNGVYACRAQIGEGFWPAAVNIGTRPTFVTGDNQSHVEAHLLDFSADLYGQQMTLEFISRLRGEERFTSVDELIAQVHNDIQRTREIVVDAKLRKSV